MIGVLVAARSVIVRAGLEAIVRESAGLHVAGSASDAKMLLEQLETAQPAVVLLDAEEAEDELLTVLLTPEESVPVVLLADGLQSATVLELMRSGVRGLLPKGALITEIEAALEAVAAGLVVLHPELAEGLLPAAPVAIPAAATEVEPLSPREIEVLTMLAEGVGNKTIARRLSISEHTVKFHISSIFSKLHVSSRTEAVILGARLGLILL